MAREKLCAYWDVVSVLTCIFHKGNIREETVALNSCLVQSTVKMESLTSNRFEVPLSTL